MSGTEPELTDRVCKRPIFTKVELNCMYKDAGVDSSDPEAMRKVRMTKYKESR